MEILAEPASGECWPQGQASKTDHGDTGIVGAWPRARLPAPGFLFKEFLAEMLKGWIHVM